MAPPRSSARFVARMVKGAKSAEMPGFIEPALATRRAEAPVGEKWVHEVKYDGWRVQAHLIGGEVTLFTRRGHNWTRQFYSPQRRTFKSRLFSYSALHKVDPGIAAALRGGGHDHIFMPYDKRSRDETGLIAESPAPRGMSGGPVIDGGRPVDLKVISGVEQAVPRLAGMVIELRKLKGMKGRKVLLAVRMEAILPELLRAFPAKRSEAAD